ncbi:MAG: hypothetical protein FWE17_01755 [Alphaproteobacteria bacterium]|nr:hypothetical protein [Alphaproteobacteria bacterium]MCL2757703.1 hypothetical protein [Alphaproteobacteria bacterium]
MKNLKQIFDTIFPFAITILLWRLAAPVLNPGGILAAIPIFYYSFMRPRAEFLPMAIVGCLLLDYNFGTMLFWTGMFCAAYAVHYMQTISRPMLLIHDGLAVFSMFIGGGLLILSAWAFSFSAIFTAAWMFAVSAVGYLVWIKLARKF